MERSGAPHDVLPAARAFLTARKCTARSIFFSRSLWKKEKKEKRRGRKKEEEEEEKVEKK